MNIESTIHSLGDTTREIAIGVDRLVHQALVNASAVTPLPVDSRYAHLEPKEEKSHPLHASLTSGQSVDF